MGPEVRRAIGRVEVDHGGDKPIRGTAFLVAPDRALTAFHVVADRGTHQPHGAARLVLGERSVPLTFDGTGDAVADWALLVLDTPVEGVEPLPLGRLDPADHEGGHLDWRSYGFPDAKPDGLALSGAVEAVQVPLQGREVIQVTCTQALGHDVRLPGLSGAPLMVDGVCVGILRFALMDHRAATRAGTVFACPMEALAGHPDARVPDPDPCWGLAPLPGGDLPRPPFRGLEWYGARHAEVFFGRCREIRAVMRRVERDPSPLTLLHGPSGVGKSSLVAAGVLPRLRARHEVRYLRRDAAPLATRLPEDWVGEESTLGRPLVVILDQVEEALTVGGGEAELGELATAIHGRFADPQQRPKGHLVLGFRDDYRSEIERALIAHGVDFYGRVYLRPLDRDGIVEAIEGLSRSPRLRRYYGLGVEPGLAGRIADRLLADRGAPVAPTLQLLLSEMWRRAEARAPDAPSFDSALFEAVADDGFGLAEHLAHVLAGIASHPDPALRAGLALDLLQHHVSDRGTARALPAADRAALYPHAPAHEAATTALLEHTLLVRVDDATRLVHDTLAPVVDRAFGQSEAPGPRARRLLSWQTAEWDGRDDDGLLTAPELRRYDAGAIACARPSATEATLLERSRAQHHRNTRNVFIVVMALLAAFGGVGVWNGLARQQDAIASARATMARAEQAWPRRYADAMALAADAIRQHPRTDGWDEVARFGVRLAGHAPRGLHRLDPPQTVRAADVSANHRFAGLSLPLQEEIGLYALRFELDGLATPDRPLVRDPPTEFPVQGFPDGIDVMDDGAVRLTVSLDGVAEAPLPPHLLQLDKVELTHGNGRAEYISVERDGTIALWAKTAAAADPPSVGPEDRRAEWLPRLLELLALMALDEDGRLVELEWTDGIANEREAAVRRVREAADAGDTAAAWVLQRLGW